MARLHIPRELKELKGTLRPSRELPNAAYQSDELPTRPAWLDVRAKKHFQTICDRLAAEQRLSASFTETIALAALQMLAIEDTTRHIKKHGRTIEGTTDRGAPVTRVNPHVAIQEKAVKALQSLLQDLALNPIAIQKVTKIEGPAPTETGNPFDKFK